MIHPAPDTVTSMATDMAAGIVPHGDLPDITADAGGTATKAVMLDKLKLAQIQGRSIMVHRYGTNDRGKPKGGGPRFACGVIEK